MGQERLPCREAEQEMEQPAVGEVHTLGDFTCCKVGPVHLYHRGWETTTSKGDSIVNRLPALCREVDQAAAVVGGGDRVFPVVPTDYPLIVSAVELSLFLEA